jgi:hypothetical protein
VAAIIMPPQLDFLCMLTKLSVHDSRSRLAVAQLLLLPRRHPTFQLGLAELYNLGLRQPSVDRPWCHGTPHEAIFMASCRCADSLLGRQARARSNLSPGEPAAVLTGASQFCGGCRPKPEKLCTGPVPVQLLSCHVTTGRDPYM